MSELYSWRDIKEKLQEVSPAPWVAYWAGPEEIVVECAPNAIEECEKTLSRLFGLGYNPSEKTIALYTVDEVRLLPIKIEPTEDAQSSPSVTRPLWNSTVEFSSSPVALNEKTTVAAFFSYKGGVGRTTLLLAVLRALLSNQLKPKILVIDYDVEAPGLSWLIDAPLSNGKSENSERFSFADAISLIHDSADWVAQIPLIKSIVETHKHYVDLDVGRRDFLFLPAVRTIRQAFRIPVTAEQLVRGRGKAWIMGDFLIELGKALDLDAILVDMRAGVTEFSSPLLLDSRIRSILVTSCNPQSISGTIATIGEIRRRHPSNRPPELVVSMVPEEASSSILQEINERLVEALMPLSSLGSDDPVETADAIGIYKCGFAQELVHYSDFHDLMAARLSGTELYKSVASELSGEIFTALNAEAQYQNTPEVDIAELRRGVSALEFAENNSELGMLEIPSLQKLVDSPGHLLPNSVVIGAKGAGKTFAWGQLIIAQSWTRFGQQFPSAGVKQDAKIYPLLAPKNLGDGLLEKLRMTEANVVADATGVLARSDLRQKLEDYSGEPSARTFWINAIAERLGMRDHFGDFRALLESIHSKFGRLVLVVDGLEDALQMSPEKPLSEPQKRLLRDLLQDIPSDIRELGARDFGLIIFVRRDVAASAISQNYGQFEHQHRETVLSWSAADALRLVVWMLDRFGWSLLRSTPVIAEASYEELRQALIPFWGEKMGGKREAFTDSWVIAVLSDLNLRLQARDVTRLIHAALSTTNSIPLSPASLKQSLPKVSETKIKELEIEVPSLKEIFDKLRGQDSTAKVIPFSPERFGLSDKEVRFLDDQGLVTRLKDTENYFMPEIVRHGLGFTLDGGRRAKVVSLYRAALSKKR